MVRSVHGHEVLEMMLASGRSFTDQTLEEAILLKFGPGTRFHTCSAENMTAGELVSFLKRRDKFVGTDGGFGTAPDRICGHEGHAHPDPH